MGLGLHTGGEHSRDLNLLLRLKLVRKIPSACKEEPAFNFYIKNLDGWT